jgi:hypothetical protein
VEFAFQSELDPCQVVQINLGIRDGIERTLEGLPRIVTRPAGNKGEFVYRVEGDVP